MEVSVKVRFNASKEKFESYGGNRYRRRLARHQYSGTARPRHKRVAGQDKIGDKKFKVTDTDSTYGKCAFGLTDKVSYKHQTCELAIPKSEIDTTKTIAFSLYYYGTYGTEYIGGLTGALYNSNISNSL